MPLYIKEFYYGTSMARNEYKKLAPVCIPAEIVDQYNLRALSYDGWFYLEIQKFLDV